MEYFELFNIPVSLVVNAKEVTKRYYELSKLYHPDNFSLEDADKQAEALEMSSKVNQAKKVLSNSHRRLEYILKQKGIIVAEEKYQLPPQFLAEMMDINEALMELEFDENQSTKEKIVSQVSAEIAKLYNKVNTFFDAPQLEINEGNGALLKDYYYKKKYLDRIKEKL